MKKTIVMLFAGIVVSGVVRPDAADALSKATTTCHNKNQQIAEIETKIKDIQQDLSLANELEWNTENASINEMLRCIRAYGELRTNGERRDPWGIEKQFDAKINTHPVFVKMLTDIIDEQKEKIQQHINIKMAELERRKK